MRIAFVRTDFAGRLKAGGSVAHIRGVIAGMERLGHEVLFLSTGLLTGIPAAKTAVVSPGPLRYAIFGVGNVLYNFLAFPAAYRRLRRFRPEVIYHRYSILSTLALRLARRLNVPLILEYNGSEVWVAKNWHIPLFSLAAVERAELACLKGASVISVVSEPLRQDLVARGIAADKIVVNPNGADPEEYRPDICPPAEQARLRKELDLPKDATVIGFIGTFGQWHGAPSIPKAAAMLKQQGKLPEKVRFLLVGDGIMMPEVWATIAEAGLEPWFILPGLIGQAEAPRYLSLFDIALNPTVPNQDGSEFFGSPTKLFEYMAMGLAIVSSRLGQMKDILEEGTDALLYEPGNAAELAKCLDRLIADSVLRQRLGAATLKKVRASYTWEANVRRSLEALTQPR